MQSVEENDEELRSVEVEEYDLRNSSRRNTIERSGAISKPISRQYSGSMIDQPDFYNPENISQQRLSNFNDETLDVQFQFDNGGEREGSKNYVVLLDQVSGRDSGAFHKRGYS